MGHCLFCSFPNSQRGCVEKLYPAASKDLKRCWNAHYWTAMLLQICKWTRPGNFFPSFFLLQCFSRFFIWHNTSFFTVSILGYRPINIQIFDSVWTLPQKDLTYMLLVNSEVVTSLWTQILESNTYQQWILVQYVRSFLKNLPKQCACD